MPICNIWVNRHTRCITLSLLMGKVLAMKLQGAVLKEQGQTFAIVVVKKHIVDSQFESEKAINAFMHYFPGMPVTLMAQDSRGRAKYRGRKDIVNFLTSIHPSQITWKEYTFNN